MAKFDSFGLTLPDWAIMALIILLCVSTQLLIKHLILARIIRLSDKTRYFLDGLLLRAFIKALHKRFKEESIVIPYPILALNTQQEHAFEQGKAPKER